MLFHSRDEGLHFALIKAAQETSGAPSERDRPLQVVACPQRQEARTDEVENDGYGIHG